MRVLDERSTLSTVWNNLAHPRDYVAGVRRQMMACVRQHGNTYVKIGVTGSGQKPCYRITYTDASDVDRIYGSFWDNHQPLDREDAINNNWSNVTMSFDEVDALLRERLGWPRQSS